MGNDMLCPSEQVLEPEPAPEPGRQRPGALLRLSPLVR